MPDFSRRLRPVWADVVVATAFGGFWLAAEISRLSDEDGWARGAVIVLVAVVIAASSGATWVALGALAVLIPVALLVNDSALTGLWPLSIGFVYVGIRIGVQPQRRVGITLSVLLVVGAAALALQTPGTVMAGALAGLVALGLTGGHLLRLVRGRAQLLTEQRALMTNLADAGRELTLISERSRIARDVHDIMAQSLSIVLAQADGAAKIVRADPERAQTSLGVISDVARASLVEVRMLVESLGPSAVTLEQPTLENLAQLLERFGVAGLSVGFAEDGERLQLTAGQQLAAYRIIQEALTNALRYSGEQPNAFVRLLWDTTALLLEVTSRGRPGRTPSIGSGMGVVGMRERAELAGGWLTAEESADGEAFVVTASLPAPPAEATP